MSGGADLKPTILPEAEAAQALARGRVVLVVSGGDTPTYAYDPTQPESRTARLAVDAALQRRPDAPMPFTATRAEVTEPGARYVDFLVPGLLGMNLMGTGMWGIAFSLVVARNGNLLKRLVAAPVRRSHLLGAQLTSRLIFLIPEAGALLLFAYFVLGVPMRGSIFLLVGVSAARRAGVQRPRSPDGRAAAHHRGRLGRDEPRDGADVDVLRDLLLDRAVPGGAAAVHPGAAADGAERRAARRDAGGHRPRRRCWPELALLAVWGAVSFLVALKIFRWQ